MTSPSPTPGLLDAALVTGANRGLGRALVAALLDRGAGTVYAAARDTTGLAEVADARVVPLELDLTNEGQLADVAERVGGVRLLVNNAATSAFAPLLDAPRADVERELLTNALGMLDVVRAIAPAMPSGSAVVNVLSLLSLAATPAMAGYSASKAAAHSMTQALRPSLAGHGIAVVGVYPGAIDTDMIAGVELPKAAPRSVAEAILDGVLAGEEDVFPDPMSAQLSTLWQRDPKAFERRFAAL